MRLHFLEKVRRCFSVKKKMKVAKEKHIHDSLSNIKDFDFGKCQIRLFWLTLIGWHPAWTQLVTVHHHAPLTLSPHSKKPPIPELIFLCNLWYLRLSLFFCTISSSQGLLRVLYKKDDAGTAFDGQSWEIKFLHESTKRKNVSALIQDQAAGFLNFFQIFLDFLNSFLITWSGKLSFCMSLPSVKCIGFNRGSSRGGAGSAQCGTKRRILTDSTSPNTSQLPWPK